VRVLLCSRSGKRSELLLLYGFVQPWAQSCAMCRTAEFCIAMQAPAGMLCQHHMGGAWTCHQEERVADRPQHATGSLLGAAGLGKSLMLS
jgi:hypothetical protein